MVIFKSLLVREVRTGSLSLSLGELNRSDPDGEILREKRRKILPPGNIFCPRGAGNRCFPPGNNLNYALLAGRERANPFGQTEQRADETGDLLGQDQFSRLAVPQILSDLDGGF